MSAASEMGEYAAAAFFSYEDIKDQRDEALTRCCELEDQLDVARRIAASFEAEVAKVRKLHARREPYPSPRCYHCHRAWPCPTARAVYL